MDGRPSGHQSHPPLGQYRAGGRLPGQPRGWRPADRYCPLSADHHERCHLQPAGIGLLLLVLSPESVAFRGRGVFRWRNVYHERWTYLLRLLMSWNDAHASFDRRPKMLRPISVTRLCTLLALLLATAALWGDTLAVVTSPAAQGAN